MFENVGKQRVNSSSVSCKYAYQLQPLHVLMLACSHARMLNDPTCPSLETTYCMTFTAREKVVNLLKKLQSSGGIHLLKGLQLYGFYVRKNNLLQSTSNTIVV